MISFDQIVTKALSDITGITVDLTTVCVGIIVVVVILCGLDFLKDVLLGGVSSESKESNVPDRQQEYDEYERKRYWKEAYKFRYEGRGVVDQEAAIRRRSGKPFSLKG